MCDGSWLGGDRILQQDGRSVVAIGFGVEGGDRSWLNPNHSPLNLKHSQLSCDRSSMNLWRSWMK